MNFVNQILLTWIQPLNDSYLIGKENGLVIMAFCEALFVELAKLILKPTQKNIGPRTLKRILKMNNQGGRYILLHFKTV